ncbi:MAG: hypothetical protein LUG16_04250 [Candidatus Gastranaerophilales bacterium]|nr:hypothetical protein [Candidatus Gastranaerophilales bacterium]
MLRIKSDGGDLDYTISSVGMTGMKNWFNTYFVPLITTKVCYYTSGCWYDGYIKKLSGGNFTSQSGTWGLGSSTIMFVLNDGTTVSIDDSSAGQVKSIFGVDVTGYSVYTITMWFDINGLRQPNTIGKDVFAVVYDSKRGLIPACYDMTSSEIEKNCSSTGSGVCCIHKYLKS